MAEDAGSSTGLGRPPAGPRGRARRRTALVVDDDPATRRFVVTVLRKHGFTVIEAPDGRAALRQMVEHHGRLDLLVTDFQMPNLTGLELAAMVRLARPEAVVVIMTGDAGPLAGDGTGEPESVLLKPFTVDELLDAVAAAFAAGP